jgi:hypothetical protein
MRAAGGNRKGVGALNFASGPTPYQPHKKRKPRPLLRAGDSWSWQAVGRIGVPAGQGENVATPLGFPSRNNRNRVATKAFPASERPRGEPARALKREGRDLTAPQWATGLPGALRKREAGRLASITRAINQEEDFRVADEANYFLRFELWLRLFVMLRLRKG